MHRRRLRDTGAAFIALLCMLLGCDSYDASLLPSVIDNTVDAGRGPLTSRPMCGNGEVDEGEVCDVAIAADQEGACPTSCPTEDPCNPQVLAGSDCKTECVGLQTTQALNGDGCCPPGVGAGEDSDCGGCGDGIVGPMETCEPAASCATRDGCKPLNACLLAVFSGDPASCSSLCRLDLVQVCKNDDGCCPSACDPSTDDDCSGSCGNGIVERDAGETCEPGSSDSPCPSTCDDGNVCTSDVSSGLAKNCNLTCFHVDITTPANSDGCCPVGANALNDSDCAPACGNSVREVGETCDPCPTDCTDSDECTTDGSSGSACNLTCTHAPITEPDSGDGCCPSGANATNDSDCAAVCGNQVREGYETCDPCPGSCDDGIGCTTDQSTGSAGACTLVCSHTTITQATGGDGCCPSGANATTDSDCSPACGNGVTESGEECDGGGLCRDCELLFDSSLVHRYTFEGTGGTVTDSVGSAHGTVVGGNLSGSANVNLTGGSSGPYVNLPNGLISSLTNATIEMWLTWRGGNDWQRAFDIGNNTNGENNQGGTATSEWFITPCNASNHVDMVMNFTSSADDTGNDQILEHNAALSQNVKHQLVGVFDDSNNVARLYIDGVQVASKSNITSHLSSIDDKNVWVGRSNYANDELNAVVHEFRIYSKALSAAEIQASYQATDNP